MHVSYMVTYMADTFSGFEENLTKAEANEVVEAVVKHTALSEPRIWTVLHLTKKWSLTWSRRVYSEELLSL